MHTKIKLGGIIGSIFLIVFTVIARDETVDRLAVKFSDPGKPGLIEVGLVNGGIHVTGYNGDEVQIEAETRTKKLTTANTNPKAKGMFRIHVASTGLSVEEENNKMEIGVESWRRTIDLRIRVPYRTSLKLSCVNAGDINVENVEGEFDISNINGKVTLANVSGAVVAHALNQDLTVNFEKIARDKPMSFSTLNGDIDVTFPENLKASVKMKTDNGDIFSDFEVKLSHKSRKVVEENESEKNGKYRIKIDPMITGNINGGGPEFQFKSFNGDIFIRKR